MTLVETLVDTVRTLCSNGTENPFKDFQLAFWFG